MSGLGLGIGLKGLLSSRSAMDVIGNNLSNASTPGYSRQDLSVSSGRQINLRGLGFGTGVDGQVVNRSIDELLQKRIVEQIGNMNALDARLDVLRQVESILGEPGEFGLQTKLESFFSGFGELAADPSDPVLRSGAVQSADTLASRLRTLSAEVQDLDGNQLGQVSAQIDRVNELTHFVSRLNQDIAQTEASGIPANQMRDQRELALKELGALVDVRYVEDDIGIVRVTVGGQLVVGAEQAYPIEANKNEDGEIELTLRGNDKPLQVRSGALGGLTQANGGGGTIGDLGARLDRLASNLILEANRLHSTGVPLDGPFQSLTGTNALTDEDGDGTLTDELLTEAGLPFDVQDGRLHINVTEEATGLVQTYKIDIDADRMTVAEFVQELDGIDRISAEIDPEGKLRINSDGGYGFDFAARLETAPDPNGTFGGGRPSIGAETEGPYALAPGDTLTLQGLTGPYTVTFQPADFEDINAATAEEIAAVINANAGTAANGLQAVVEGDALFVQGLTPGAGQSFLVNGGSAAASFGWAAPTTVVGSDVASEVTIGGTYSGESDQVFTFQPMTDGTIGTTPGLMVEVRNENGLVVARLDVGEDYEPGTVLEVEDGITVSFGFGELSATDNDRVSLDLIADGDSSDVLVAMGINSLFTGSTAGDLDVREDLLRAPERLSVSATGAPGDNGIALALENLGALGVEGLDNSSLGEFWGEVTGEVGFETAAAGNAIEVEAQLVASLEARREQVSGVNVDEELVNMIQYEQAFAASSQFIQVVNGLNDDLLSLV